MDPQEIHFDFTRPHRFVDLEDSTTVVAEPNLIAEEYTAAIQEFLTTTEASCHDVRADYHLVTSDQNYEEVLRDFLTNRLPKKGKK
tara:strand:+ start:237 stop:494 length:258 start_codon:yes stop_codon:yes gene_type:complete